MPLQFDIKVLGSPQLERALGQLPKRSQNRVMKRVLRGSAKRIHNEILINFSGRVVDERTGRTVAAIEANRPRLVRNNEHGLVVGIRIPTRAQLGIPRRKRKKDGFFFTALEYDVRLGPKMPIRRAVNAVQDAELDRMTRDIAEGIEREWIASF